LRKAASCKGGLLQEVCVSSLLYVALTCFSFLLLLIWIELKGTNEWIATTKVNLTGGQMVWSLSFFLFECHADVNAWLIILVFCW
jgi:hypothetical protein